MLVYISLVFCFLQTVASKGFCGSRPNTRIVGGTPAGRGDWPWQAQIRGRHGWSYCGGTLIDPQWVVTATHCVEDETDSKVFVRMGAHRRDKVYGTEQDFEVVKLVMHPEYHNPKSYANDIALLQLDRPAILNRYVNLACLPERVAEPADGDKCWTTGWGKLHETGFMSNRLMQVSVPVTSQERCKKAYPGLIDESMMCAGRDKGGIDTCQGDSGGPLVCETGGRYYLQGVVSWGEGCGDKNKFGVYARVKYQLDWIKRVMSGAPPPPGTPKPAPVTVPTTGTSKPPDTKPPTETDGPPVCEDNSSSCKSFKRHCKWNAEIRQRCPKTCKLC